MCPAGDSESNMIPRIIVTLLVGCVLCTAGCIQTFSAASPSPDGAEKTPVAASYAMRIAQPEDSARLIQMDTDVYNIGEVVEFVITNVKTSDLSCLSNPPSFSVRYQTGSGKWLTRMGSDNPVPGNTTILKPGEATPPYRFVTTGWAPGRYRIVTDCGVSREILLRALPSVLPSGSACPPAVNKSPFIKVSPATDRYVGEIFPISGTTSLAAGEELRYSIFAVRSETGNISSPRLVSGTVKISEGACGINTWYVEGQILVPGDYFIGISNNANTISAVRRFTVLMKAGPAATGDIPVKTPAIGIVTA